MNTVRALFFIFLYFPVVYSRLDFWRLRMIRTLKLFRPLPPIAHDVLRYVYTAQVIVCDLRQIMIINVYLFEMLTLKIEPVYGK